MRKICIINQKGGVGKTTTAVNLAAGLSRRNKKVLLVDLDPQGNINTSLKVKAEYDIYDALIGSVPIHDSIVNVAKNFDIITSRETLTKAESYLLRNQESRMLLRQVLDKLAGFEYIIVDCPPSLGVLSQNALAFCEEAFVPVSTDYLGYDALLKMQDIIRSINNNYGTRVRITKIIPTMYDRRNKICKETLATIQQEFPKLASYPIRSNSKLKEAPKYGKSIFSYANSSQGAKDYNQLVEEVLIMKELRKEAVAQ